METRDQRPAIKNFQDLIVYQNLYLAMVSVHREIMPKLPKEEKFVLVDQMRRSSKAGPALLAEGFAKRFQLRQWQKYLNDATGECNETIHHLTACIDLYPSLVDAGKCRELIDLYDKSCRQMNRLGQSWKNFHEAQ